MFNFTFTNRTQYLLQKREWFVHYQAAVKALQKAKDGIKEANRSNRLTIHAYVVKDNAGKDVQQLLEARWESRREANRQRQATLTKVQ